MNKTDEALANILTTLAAKFGTTADHLYAIMIKQAFIDGIESLIAIIFFTAAFIILSIKLHKWMVSENIKDPTYGWDFDDNPFLVVSTCIIGVAWLAVFFICGTSMIDCFFNPEYYALHQILKTI